MRYLLTKYWRRSSSVKDKGASPKYAARPKEPRLRPARAQRPSGGATTGRENGGPFGAAPRVARATSLGSPWKIQERSNHTKSRNAAREISDAPNESPGKIIHPISKSERGRGKVNRSVAYMANPPYPGVRDPPPAATFIDFATMGLRKF